MQLQEASSQGPTDSQSGTFRHSGCPVNPGEVPEHTHWQWLMSRHYEDLLVGQGHRKQVAQADQRGLLSNSLGAKDGVYIFSVIKSKNKNNVGTYECVSQSLNICNCPSQTVFCDPRGGSNK